MPSQVREPSPNNSRVLLVSLRVRLLLNCTVPDLTEHINPQLGIFSTKHIMWLGKIVEVQLLKLLFEIKFSIQVEGLLYSVSLKLQNVDGHELMSKIFSPIFAILFGGGCLKFWALGGGFWWQLRFGWNSPKMISKSYWLCVKKMGGASFPYLEKNEVEVEASVSCSKWRAFGGHPRDSAIC